MKYLLTNIILIIDHWRINNVKYKKNLKKNSSILLGLSFIFIFFNEHPSYIKSRNWQHF